MNATLTIDEESRVVLRRIVESLAWRQIATIDILGHGLKFVTELDTKQRVAGELQRALLLFRHVRDLYGELGWSELDAVVRERGRGLPYPESRIEFGLAYYVCGLAEEVAMRGYLDSTYGPFANIAREHVEAAASRPEPTRFLEYCSEPSHRPHGQELIDLWVPVGRRWFGRPDSKADARALQLGLKAMSAAQMDKTLCERLAPFLETCGLSLPGVEGESS
jgi:1,2-phenylacetyl-CoA epoxidase catalytic subunit